MKNIEWVRALTRKSQIKQRKRNIRRNYKRVYCDIKSRAKMGLNSVNIHYNIYDQNVRRFIDEGYKVEKKIYASGTTWEIVW
jgi:uncharacterized protein (UPF0128 family)